MTKPDEDDLFLEQFFEAARSDSASPSDGLMARVLADAEAVQDELQPGADTPALQPGVWAGLVAALGGWPAMAGLATATVAGLWFGAASPDLLDGVIGLGLSTEQSFDLGDIGFGDVAALDGDL